MRTSGLDANHVCSICTQMQLPEPICKKAYGKERKLLDAQLLPKLDLILKIVRR
jgi:hypothetical protein